MLLLCAVLGQARADALDSCLSALAADPRFGAIAGRLALGARAEATGAMLADAATPAGRQLRAIAEWTAARSDCIRAEAEFGNASYRPPLQAYRLEAESGVIEAAADLHDRKVSYGEFNRRRQALAEELRGKVALLHRQIQSQQARQAQADQQARERQQLQRNLEDVERQANLAQQQSARAQQEAEQARRDQRSARRPAAGAGQPYPMVRPRVAPPVPYASCFQLDGRIVCTYR